MEESKQLEVQEELKQEVIPLHEQIYFAGDISKYNSQHEQKHVKAFLKGKLTFQDGFTLGSDGINRPNMYEVKRSHIQIL